MKTRKTMKKVVTLIVALALALAALTASAFADNTRATAETQATTIDQPLQPGDHIPDFTVTLADGSVFTLSEALKTHKAVMINLWATWCCGCCDEMPVMQEAYKGYEDDVAIVCLSAYDTNEEILAFAKENNLTLPLGSDTVGLTGAMTRGYLPTTIIIDRFGNYAYYEDGSIGSVEGWTNIWDLYISNDYTQTQVIVKTF